jgi:RNA-directed DNA polymerase
MSGLVLETILDELVVITSRRLRFTLQQKVMPAIRDFLEERVLSLSAEKTKIIPIEEGFDFLGQNLREHGDKFIIPDRGWPLKGLSCMRGDFHVRFL